MSTFSENYDLLNDAQKQAVDAIDGPVMVIAGPGTGKTQLLSMRVANILKKTDALPSNILCLTFTESGQAAMRKRLIELMGPEAYGVAIHTFHSFGSEVINTYSQFFYHGAHFQAADELSSYEILRDIFEKLPHDSSIKSLMNEEFTHLRDTQKAISYLKKSGLTPDELLLILDNNQAFIETYEGTLAEVFNDRISKRTLPKLENVAAKLTSYQDDPLKIPTFKPIAQVVTSMVEKAIQTTAESNNTKPLTALKSLLFTKNNSGQLVFKDRLKDEKLRAVAGVYYDYLVAMRDQTLYDFDDMILRVVHAIEVFAQLRYELQERYQYILVDEFQDTNGAQLRLLFNLTNNEASDGQPNIMAVGDDDQAIYSFQGAEIGNILAFRETYKDVRLITLTENYRSTKPILELARSVITLGSERLENVIPNLIKEPIAHHTNPKSAVQLSILRSPSKEYQHVIDLVQAELATGTLPQNIAVIGRNHSHLLKVLPYFHNAEVPVAYERRDNVLASPPIVILELLAQVVVALSNQAYDAVDAKLPELLSHPAWGISPSDLWRLGLKAFNNRELWLEIMLATDGQLKDIAQWLLKVAKEAPHQPLELMLDTLLGSHESQVAEFESAEGDDGSFTIGRTEEYASPIRTYFFKQSALNNQAAKYLSFLAALTTLRQRLCEYKPSSQLHLDDFIRFLDLHARTGITISSSSEYRESENAVQLMTAHKSKGQEFDSVFIINLADDIWGTATRGHSRLINFPANLPITPAGETDDERLRLLFVAMTRARNRLFLSSYTVNERGRESVIAKYLQANNLPEIAINKEITTAEEVKAAEATWHERLILMPKGDMKKLLAPTLEKYQLSATHLNNFTDITRGGPQTFLLQNLLRFPQGKSIPAIFGLCIHATLQRAHTHLSATGEKRPLEDILHDYENLLTKQRISPNDFEHLAQRGSMVLSNFFKSRYDDFRSNQIGEKDFVSQGAVVGGVKLSGKIDLIEIDKANKEIIVTDYKTGKPQRTWIGKTDYQRIKLHKFRQQLMLYKLLVENSRDYGGKYQVNLGVLEFVEPADNKEVVRLELDFKAEELERFKQLIAAVWSKIQTLDLPYITKYEPSMKGILQFEDDLINENS